VGSLAQALRAATGYLSIFLFVMAAGWHPVREARPVSRLRNF
jgi:hypothetical protein